MSKIIVSEYLEGISEKEPDLITEIEGLLEKFQTTPVGDGFIDIITPADNIEPFIESMTNLGVAINVVTLWCNCTPANEAKFGCPHGFGGPRHQSGYYSEMCERDPFDVEETFPDLIADDANSAELVAKYNAAIREYTETGMESRPEYSRCLVPGFWLVVPKDWKRQSYRVPERAS